VRMSRKYRLRCPVLSQPLQPGSGGSLQRRCRCCSGSSMR
jgi:hypothetical protein